MPRTAKRRVVIGPSTRHLYFNDEPMTGDDAAAIIGFCFWCCKWADAVEQTDEPMSGMEISHSVPPMPQEFLFFGHNALGRLEQAQRTEYGSSWCVMLYQAAKADGVEALSNMDKRIFFWQMAMMMQGHGSSWFDDHERFDLKPVYHPGDDLDAEPYLYGTTK